MISDPWFYLAAVPAVLLIGLSKSGFAAGIGTLAVPMLALAVPVPTAAAVLLPLLTVIDLLSLRAYRGEYDRGLLKMLLPAGLAGVGVGTLLFGVMQPRTVGGVVGALTLLFLAQRRLFPPHAQAAPPARWWGALMGATSGFTSFVSHTGGPPLAAYLLPLKLAPVRFAATAAVFFTAVNGVKWLPYAALGLFDSRNLLASALLLPVAPVGVWIGQRLTRRVSPALFYRLIDLGMLLTGLKLVWDAL